MTSLRRFASFRCSVVLAVLLAGGVRASAETEAEPVEVTIRGQSIAELQVIGDEATAMHELEGVTQGYVTDGRAFRMYETFYSPGRTISLPAGKYYVVDIVRHGGYTPGSMDMIPFEVTPQGPNELDIGGPLRATVTVTRCGGFLRLDYQVADAQGKPYRVDSASRGDSSEPSFQVLLNNEEIGSGTFEYG